MNDPITKSSNSDSINRGMCRITNFELGIFNSQPHFIFKYCFGRSLSRKIVSQLKFRRNNSNAFFKAARIKFESKP